jgi:hypothetical protein
VQMFAEHSLWVPTAALICAQHLHADGLKSTMRVHPSAFEFKPVTLADIQDLARRNNDPHVRKDAAHTFVSFDDASLTEDDYWSLTGVKKADFDELVQTLGLRTGSIWTQRNSLGVFLMKLRVGLSHRELGTLFRQSVKSVHQRIKATRRLFLQANGFVESNLGVSHTSRDELIRNHTTELARQLYGDDKLILVEDCTYVYIQKSQDYTFARRTFSTHKYRHLVKPMVCCTTDGYYVDVFGPYLADGSNSDAKIFIQQHLQDDVDALRNILQEGDTWIVDRGFRECQEHAPDLDVWMPSFGDEDSKILNTQDANDSRMVTKLRWVVESGNARLKTFKFFARVVSNTQIRHVGSYCRIVAAICNKYRPPLSTDKPHHAEMATAMLNRLYTQNDFAEECKETALIRRSTEVWEDLNDSHVPHFPLLSEDDIIQHITFGAYQIHNARSYINEHFDRHGDLQLQRARPSTETAADVGADKVIHVRLQSRHKSNKDYRIFIKLDPRQSLPWKKIAGWYCSCPCGSRTLGCCSHVTAVIWWLGHGRLQAPKVRLNMWRGILDAASVDYSKEQFVVPPPRKSHATASQAVMEHAGPSVQDASSRRLNQTRACYEPEADEEDTLTADSDGDEYILSDHPVSTDEDDATLLENEQDESQHTTAARVLLTLGHSDSRIPQYNNAQLAVVVEAIPPALGNLARTNAAGRGSARQDLIAISDTEIVVTPGAASLRQALGKVKLSMRISTTFQYFFQHRKISDFELTMYGELRKIIADNIFAEAGTLWGHCRFQPSLSIEVRTDTLWPLLQHHSTHEMWLSAEVINCYLPIICEKQTACFAQLTYLWKKLRQGADIAQYWRVFDEHVENVFVPVNVADDHWTLLILNIQERTWTSFDPLSTLNNCHYDELEAAAKKSLSSRKRGRDDEEIRFHDRRTSLQHIIGFRHSCAASGVTLKQNDGYNCGIIVLLVAEMISSRFTCSSRTFTEQELLMYRYWITLQICNKMQLYVPATE